MFTVLKSIIERNETFDKGIVAICSDLQEEVRAIQRMDLPEEVQERIDNISNIVDFLETSPELNFTEEIDDLKGEFSSLLTVKIERDNYFPTNCQNFETNLENFLTWE